MGITAGRKGTRGTNQGGRCPSGELCPLRSWKLGSSTWTRSACFRNAIQWPGSGNGYPCEYIPSAHPQVGGEAWVRCGIEERGTCREARFQSRDQQLPRRSRGPLLWVQPCGLSDLTHWWSREVITCTRCSHTTHHPATKP